MVLSVLPALEAVVGLASKHRAGWHFSPKKFHQFAFITPDLTDFHQRADFSLSFYGVH
jgi:hypothetical protein